MRNFSPLELIRSHGWSSAFFTTYSLSLAYFEAVILDALVRQNVRQNFILADVVGVRAALSEHGARFAGRSYQVEPVAVEHGCFHAKMMALTAPDEAHLVIGSGNITVGGWGSNLECIEHLHAGFAADAFEDAADFLESLATADTVRHGAVESCGRQAEALRRAVAGAPRNGNIRLVTNFEASIFDQVVRFVDELGGANRLAVASPFFDNGLAIDTLCARLGLDQVFVHAHTASAVVGTMGLNWPDQAKITVSPIIMEPLAEEPRRLHAKIFEIVCRKGRIVMSGSANATTAALAKGKNIELSVLRIDRNQSVGWGLTPTSRLATVASTEDEREPESDDGILRAVMRGDDLDGQILTRFPAGDARVFQLTGTGPKELATVHVGGDGAFTLKARGLERQSWAAQRLVLRVQSIGEDKKAEGFVFFPDVAEVTRRAGPVAARLLAVLSGTETPEDVAAVMSWFFEHPEHLRQAVIGGGGGDRGTAEGDHYTSTSQLLNPLDNLHRTGAGDRSGSAGSWQRFMDQVLASFRTPRGNLAFATYHGDGDEEEGEAPLSPEVDAETAKAMNKFEGGISDKVSYSKNSSELNGHSTVQTPQNSIDMQS